jgi:hypothetical protein
VICVNENDVIISGEKYSSADLKLLTGLDAIGEPKGYILLLARILKEPLRLPWQLKNICGLCLSEGDQRDFRLALIRVQVEADLRMNEDIQRYQQRRYVAQVIEILLFNELMLAPREAVEEVELD